MGDRHQFRAKWHDYNGGIYFITICSHQKRHTFGSIVGAQYIAPAEQTESEVSNQFKSTPLGNIIEKCIINIPTHHDDCEVWNYVIMPNHIHLILFINSNSDSSQNEKLNESTGCLKPPRYGDRVEDNHFNSALAVVIRTFKAAVTRAARAQCIAPLPVWQRNFHEHIIRNQRSFDNIMNYIDTNIENWNKDCFYG